MSAEPPRRAVERSAVVALIGLSIVSLTWDASLLNTMMGSHMNDFGKFYYSTRAFLGGGDMYAPSPATALTIPGRGDVQLLDLNPPHFHLLVVPFALLSPTLAVTAWMAVGVFALLFSMILIARQIGFQPTPLRSSAIACGTLAFCGTQAFFGTGQLSMLLLLGMTICWLNARQDRWSRAGAWLGVCSSVKPFLLLLVVYLLMKRRFRAVGSALIAIALAYAAAVAIFGVEPHVSWYRALVQSDDWAWLAMNASIFGFVGRSFGESPYFAAIAMLPALVKSRVVIAVFVALVALAAAARAPVRREVDFAFALLLIAAVLVTPLGWVYYLWLPAGPLAAIAWQEWRHERAWPAWRRGIAAAAIAGLAAPLSVPYLFQPHPGATLVLGSIYFWGTAALWSCLVADVADSAQLEQPLAAEA